MNVLIRIIVAAIIGAVVYAAMIEGNADHSVTLSTAFLVAAGVMPLIDPRRITGTYQDCRRRSFERRIDVSRDHVKTVVKEVVQEVLPPR